VTALAAAGLAKAFGSVAVLREVSFSLESGERLAVLGPSGSGKTTLLRVLAGLEVPDAGEVRLDGQLATGAKSLLPPHRRGMGVVFQFPALWPHMTVRDNIAFGVTDVDRASARERAEALLAQLELAGLGDRYPDEISGGQAKRVALARALAPARPILLLDEPVTHVEPALREHLLAVVRAHVEAHRVTLLYITHDEAEAARMAPRLARLEAGRLTPLSEPSP
jgi:iron(III) transport system ATP-binding protein